MSSEEISKQNHGIAWAAGVGVVAGIVGSILSPSAAWADNGPADHAGITQLSPQSVDTVSATPEPGTSLSTDTAQSTSAEQSSVPGHTPHVPPSNKQRGNQSQSPANLPDAVTLSAPGTSETGIPIPDAVPKNPPVTTDRHQNNPATTQSESSTVSSSESLPPGASTHTINKTAASTTASVPSGSSASGSIAKSAVPHSNATPSPTSVRPSPDPTRTAGKSDSPGHVPKSTQGNRDISTEQSNIPDVIDLPAPGQAPLDHPKLPTPASVPITANMAGTVTNFSQHDPLWASRRYGPGNISENGCGPTSLADVDTTLTGIRTTPDTTASWLIAHGGVDPNGATYHSAMIEEPHSHGLRSQALPNFKDLNVDRQVFAEGGFIIINGSDKDPRTPATPLGHFIVLRAITPAGMIQIADPNKDANAKIEWTPDQIFGHATFAVEVLPAVHHAPIPAPAPSLTHEQVPPSAPQPPKSGEALPDAIDVPTPSTSAAVGPPNLTSGGVPLDTPSPSVIPDAINLPGPGTTTKLTPNPNENIGALGLNKAQSQIIDALDLSLQDKNFLAQAMAAALSLREQGILINPQVMVAQACLETGYGQHTPPDSNNFFGIKAAAGTPPDQISWAWTHEVIHGQSVKVFAPFRKYPSMEAGLKAQADFFASRPWFADALNAHDVTDAAAFLDDILDDGMAYATQPKYKTMILSAISTNRLDDIVAAH